MRTSNLILLRLGVLCGGPLCGLLLADDLTLGGGARLTGTVRSINEAGVVELASKLSPDPLRLQSGVVEKVEFSAKSASPAPPPALVELTNGDLLPGAIDVLDDTHLILVSPEAGRLEIPRDALKSVQLGVQQRKVIYSGPRSLVEWNGGEEAAKNWTFDQNGLIANGQATASQDLALPLQFILRFTLKWQVKQLPNFQVYFADPLKAKGEPCERYFLRFSGAGLDVKRETTKGKRYIDILQLNRTPNQYPERQLQVEIRVNRKGSRLQVFLNGESEGEFVDPLPAVPDGTGITLASTAPNGSSQEIRDIEVLELDDSRGRHHSEERGDPKSDSLISREDDRWGGRLLDIRKTDDGPIFRFKSDFQKDPLEIPQADVSTIFFAVKDGKVPDEKVHPFVLRLRGEGALSVASCLFSGDAVSAVHPLLGPMNFRRQGIVALERNDPKPKPAPEP